MRAKDRPLPIEECLQIFFQPIMTAEKVRKQFSVGDDWQLFQAFLITITALICQTKSIIGNEKRNLAFDFNQMFLKHAYCISIISTCYILC